jgi:hypothetical protein
MRPLLLLSFLALSACSSRADRNGPGVGPSRVEASCLPDRPECLRVLPGIGTYSASVTIETRATSVPPAPAGGEPDQWTPARMELAQKETILLRRDAGGNVQGVRELADEDGFHFALVDTEFCLGFRYEPAVCRGADEGEVERRFQELAGTYREVLSWIDWRSRWEADGDGGFTLRAVDADPGAGDDWRKQSQIQEIKGNFSTDPKTGDHRVRLDFTLSGVRPDAQRFTLRVQYEHTVSSSSEPIRVPEGALHQTGRHRPLLDRKALLGDPTPHTLRHLYKSRSED